jgi:hypothetical protein
MFRLAQFWSFLSFLWSAPQPNTSIGDTGSILDPNG